MEIHGLIPRNDSSRRLIQIFCVILGTFGREDMRMPDSLVEKPHAIRDPVAKAMEQVFEVERDGEARLKKCREQAAATVMAARDRAAAVSRRMNSRLSALHGRYLKRIDAEIEDLKKAQSGEGGSRMPSDTALAAAASRLAARLTE
jgi:vacuolar-type H+-ATPase subunit H